MFGNFSVLQNLIIPMHWLHVNQIGNTEMLVNFKKNFQDQFYDYIFYKLLESLHVFPEAVLKSECTHTYHVNMVWIHLYFKVTFLI